MKWEMTAAFPPLGFPHHPSLRHVGARRGQHRTRGRGSPADTVSLEIKANSCPVNSLKFLRPFLSKPQNAVDNLYDLGICFNVFRAQWTLPKSREQGRALEAVSVTLHSEDMFPLSAGFIRDLPRAPWCHDIFDSLGEEWAFSAPSAGLGYRLWTVLSKEMMTEVSCLPLSIPKR